MVLINVIKQPKQFYVPFVLCYKILITTVNIFSVFCTSVYRFRHQLYRSADITGTYEIEHKSPILFTTNQTFVVFVFRGNGGLKEVYG